MFSRSKQSGFTLIELLLVVVIIGILLAVIVPRAWRANVDAKYGLVRQNATELASFASQWAEQMLEAQDLASTSLLSSYFISLSMVGTGPAPTQASTPTAVGGQWLSRGTSNWKSGVTRQVIAGRKIGGPSTPDIAPESAVEDLVPPERLPRNPFTGSSVFNELPTTSTVIPGAIAAGYAGESSTPPATHFGLVFQGTDSQPGTIGNSANSALFHAGMGTDLPGLRNGVFMARILRQ